MIVSGTNRWLFAVLLIAASCSGCKSWQHKSSEGPFAFLNHKQESEKQASEKADSVKPVKIVTLWKDATLPTTSGRTIRGFAGRVYFFDKEENSLEVDGDFIVYGFDDTNESKSREEADKKFVTKSTDLARKHSVSKIGSSYSIWLPWDEAGGGYHKKITLMPMFRGTNGQVLRGEPSENVLPGKKPEFISEREDFLKHFRKSVREGDVAPAAYEVDSLASENGRAATVKKMRSTSITLPQSMSERMGLNQQARQTVALQSDSPTADVTQESELSTDTDIASPNQIDGDASPQASRISASERDTVAKRNAVSRRGSGNFRRIPITPMRSE